jgi:hypothetical protein
MAAQNAYKQNLRAPKKEDRLKLLSVGPKFITSLMSALLVGLCILLQTSLACCARDKLFNNVPFEPGAATLPEQTPWLYEPSPLMSGSKDISDTVCNMTNGRGRGRRGPGRAVTMIRQQNRRDQGHKFRPEKLPPDFVERPWNSFTFSATYAAPGFDASVEIKFADIREYIRAKVGLAPTAKIYLKIEKARCWGTSVGPTFVLPFLRAYFYELQADSAGAVQSRTQLSDHGALSDPARVAYFWPLTDRKAIISASSNIVFLLMQGTVGADLTAMVNVLWYSAPGDENKLEKSIPAPQRDGELADFDLGDPTPSRATLAARS